MDGLSIDLVTVVVPDYDDALSYFRAVLGFVVIEDTCLCASKRWVVVAPNKTSSMRLLLAKAANSEQRAVIGGQTGGRVFLFLSTVNFEETYQKYLTNGVNFIEAPRCESYGMVVKFKDTYGNLWDLVQSRLE